MQDHVKHVAVAFTAVEFICQRILHLNVLRLSTTRYESMRDEVNVKEKVNMLKCFSDGYRVKGHNIALPCAKNNRNQKKVSKQTCMRVFECPLFVNKQRVVVCSQKPTNVILGQDDEEWKESGGHC